MCDRTVPSERPTSSAISAYDNPCQTRRTTTARCAAVKRSIAVLTRAAVSVAIAVSAGDGSGAAGSASPTDTAAGLGLRNHARHLLSAIAYSHDLNGRGKAYCFRLSHTARK